MVYIILVTTKQTPILDTQKIKESKHTHTKKKTQKPSKHKGRQQDMKEQRNYNAARE